MRCFIKVLVWLLLCMPLVSQAGVLKGRVTDVNGAALPYAAIFLEGTTHGVNTNTNGEYLLQIKPGLHTVVCQYIGYKQEAFRVQMGAADTILHDVVLEELSLQMDEVVVRANTEDPAYAIIRSTISKRAFHLEQLASFTTGVYLKGVATSGGLPDKFMGEQMRSPELGLDSNGKGILYLIEEYADYYRKGDKEKTIIHAVRESGNENGFGIPRFPEVVTFYHNNVRLLFGGTRGFISPISDNALNYYRYKFLGQFTENGYTIYKIKVDGIRAFEPCFNGVIYIVDKEWAIHSLKLTVTKASGMDLLDTLHVAQLFLPLSADNWVIKSQVNFFTIRMLGFDVKANFVTVYNNQSTNEPIPDSIFADKILSRYDSDATKKDSAYWQEARPVPLAVAEAKDYILKDSLIKIYGSGHYLDSQRKRANRITLAKVLIRGMEWRSKGAVNTVTVNPVLFGVVTDNVVNFNIVEGYNVAPKVSWAHKVDSATVFHADLAARYGFSNRHGNAIGRAYMVWNDVHWRTRSWLAGMEGGQYVFQYNSSNPVMPMLTTYADLFFRQNDLKIYERREFAGFVRRNYGNGLDWFLKASYQERIPLQNTTDYSILDGNMDGYTPNTPRCC